MYRVAIIARVLIYINVWTWQDKCGGDILLICLRLPT